MCIYLEVKSLLDLVAEGINVNWIYESEAESFQAVELAICLTSPNFKIGSMTYSLKSWTFA